MAFREEERFLPLFQPGRLEVGRLGFRRIKGRNCSKAHSSQAGFGSRGSAARLAVLHCPPVGGRGTSAMATGHWRAHCPGLLSSLFLSSHRAHVRLEAARTSASHTTEKQRYKNWNHGKLEKVRKESQASKTHKVMTAMLGEHGSAEGMQRNGARSRRRFYGWVKKGRF